MSRKSPIPKTPSQYTTKEGWLITSYDTHYSAVKGNTQIDHYDKRTVVKVGNQQRKFHKNDQHLLRDAVHNPPDYDPICPNCGKRHDSSDLFVFETGYYGKCCTYICGGCNKPYNHTI